MACKGSASGSATTIESTPAIITIGSMSTVAWTLRKIVTLSANSTDTPIASRLPARRPASSESANMITMPANATAIAIPVRNGTRSCRKTRAASAARNGEMLIRTNVFATVVRVIDAMNRKNWPARNAPASNPGQPTASTARDMRPRCMIASAAATNSAMNNDRQKTISHASRMDSKRTNNPPVDQQTGAISM